MVVEAQRVQAYGSEPDCGLPNLIHAHAYPPVDNVTRRVPLGLSDVCAHLRVPDVLFEVWEHLRIICRISHPTPIPWSQHAVLHSCTQLLQGLAANPYIPDRYQRSEYVLNDKDLSCFAAALLLTA